MRREVRQARGDSLVSTSFAESRIPARHEVASDMNGRASRASDLTRLVQHVALNESGWWQRAVERVVLASAYILGPSSTGDIRNSVTSLCGLPPNSDRISATIEHLINSGSIVNLDGILRLSEEIRESLARQEADTQSSEQRVLDRFTVMAQERGLADRVEELWSVMETAVVLPIISQMGARLYGLLTAPSEDEDDNLEVQIADLLSKYGDQVRSLLTDFLDPDHHDVRGFVLRRLNAQYVVDAAALPHDALSRLSHLNQRTGRIDIFLDTNFVFSVLGLHDNPGDDVANDLLSLVRELRERVNLRLYVLPDTVQEARLVLREVMFRLGNFRGQINLADAATRSGATGLTGRYFEEVKRLSTRVTPEAFFGPYESDLLTMLRSKSVELYNTDLEHLRMAPEVVDDLHNQEDYQARHRPRGTKPYEANLHDMVLWHFTKSKQDASAESPLDIKAWVVTLDYGLISFDRHKRRISGRPRGTFEPPVCLDPSSLIQLFQFWVPSSTELEEALVGSVRQPLLFLNFDLESEKVTLRILAQLSRFEGADALSPDVASEILAKAALRERLSDTSGDDSDDEQIVREEMIEFVQQLGEELDEFRTGRAQDLARITQLERRIAAAEASTELDDERAARQRAEDSREEEATNRHNLEEQYRSLVDTAASMKTRLDGLEHTNQKLQQEVGTQQRRVRKANNWRAGTVAGISALLALGILLTSGLVLDELLRPDLVWIASCSAAAVILLFGFDLAIRGTDLAQSSWARQLQRLTSWWWTFLIAITASVIAGGILQR